MKTTPLEDLYVHTLHCFQDVEETVRNGSSTELDDMIYQALGISVLALYHCLEYENSFAIDSEISTLWATKQTLLTSMEYIRDWMQTNLVPYDSYPDIRSDMASLHAVLDIQESASNYLDGIIKGMGYIA